MSKTILMTGTSQGIGLALTKLLLISGYSIIGTNTTGFDNINKYNYKSFSLDLSNLDSIAAFEKNFQSDNIKIDILINNTGIGPDLDFDLPEEISFKKTFDVNVIGTTFFTEQMLQYLNIGGKIINISSKMGSIDFCEKNDIDWNQALMKSLISLRSSGKQDVSGKFLYVITKKISDMIIAKKGYIGSNRGEKEKPERNQKKYRPWAMWTGLLRKLGIDGLLDSHDTGSIYPSEPTQGVFFSTKNIELISTIIINQIGECDNDYYDKQKKDEIRFGLDATPKEKWFMGLERNLSKVQTELGNVKYYGMGKIERVLNNFFVLCSSLVREAKKISEDEYQALITKGIFNKDKVRYIGTNLNYILSMTGPGIITEELKIQINKAILLSDQLISSGLFDGDYSKIDFSKIGSTKEGISKSQTGVANIGKRFVRILGEMQRKFRVISYDNNMDATYKSREINDVIDSFIQTMINLESVDVKLSNRFDLNPHWRQTKEFSEIKSLVFVILEFVMNLEGSFKYQPQFAKILSKIKQIKSCVKVGYNNDKTIKFWCYQVSKK